MHSESVIAAAGGRILSDVEMMRCTWNSIVLIHENCCIIFAVNHEQPVLVMYNPNSHIA
jgi:hypothetical protein